MDVAAVASVFNKLAVSTDFSLIIEVPVVIPDTFAVHVVIAAIDVTDVAADATISVALDDFPLALAFVIFNVFIVVLELLLEVKIPSLFPLLLLWLLFPLYLIFPLL